MMSLCLSVKVRRPSYNSFKTSHCFIDWPSNVSYAKVDWDGQNILIKSPAFFSAPDFFFFFFSVFLRPHFVKYKASTHFLLFSITSKVLLHACVYVSVCVYVCVCVFATYVMYFFLLISWKLYFIFGIKMHLILTHVRFICHVLDYRY